MWSFQVWSWFVYSHNCVMYTHKTGMNIRVSDPRRTRYLPTRLCACGYTMCDKYTAHMVDCTCTIRTCTRRAGTTLCMRARHRLRSACRGCRGCRRPLMSCPAPLAACSAQPSSSVCFRRPAHAWPWAACLRCRHACVHSRSACAAERQRADGLFLAAPLAHGRSSLGVLMAGPPSAQSWGFRQLLTG